MRTLRPRKDPRRDITPSASVAPAPAGGGSLPAGPADGRLAYSVDEAARLTGLSRDLLYDEMRRGHLDYLKVGRRRLITRQHLEQFLAITPAPQPPAAGVTDGGQGGRP
jgi:excisionase family DNA binding protein